MHLILEEKYEHDLRRYGITTKATSPQCIFWLLGKRLLERTFCNFPYQPNLRHNWLIRKNICLGRSVVGGQVSRNPGRYPDDIYLFKINSQYTRTMREIQTQQLPCILLESQPFRYVIWHSRISSQISPILLFLHHILQLLN